MSVTSPMIGNHVDLEMVEFLLPSMMIASSDPRFEQFLRVDVGNGVIIISVQKDTRTIDTGEMSTG